MEVKTLQYKSSEGIFFTEPSRTKQADMERCDLQYQLARFQKTGLMGNLRSDEPLTGDFSEVDDLITAHNRLIDLEEQFMSIPAALRKKFDNDPLQMLEWLQKEENYEEAVKYGFDYVLMVDSDVILPADTLELMCSDPVDVLLGVYPRKNTVTGQTEIFKLGYFNFSDENNLNLSEIKEPGRMDIKGGGLGCALIKVSIFEALPKPWFHYKIYPNGGVLSEDNYFCCLAAEKGFKIQADTRVRCKHLVRTFIGQYDGVTT